VGAPVEGAFCYLVTFREVEDFLVTLVGGNAPLNPGQRIPPLKISALLKNLQSAI
jgi:hypothetical protein